jgi:Raf kinase inhibitor-like YbhB/YbcL family protein
MAFTVSSPAFAEGAEIPRECTCEGKNQPPPIRVSAAPAGTRSFAVIMDDPDAPGGSFTHWLAYNIPADGPELQADTAATLPNSFGRAGYGGPCPPPGRGAHRYCFTVYALDVPTLKMSKRTRQELEAVVEEHALARATLMGRFERRG